MQPKRCLYVSFFVALALRLALFLWIRPWQPEVEQERILVTDARGYHELAAGLIETGSFENFGSQRTPAYPALLAGLYAIFGAHPWIMLACQTLISALTVVVMYALGAPLFGRRAACLAALLLACDVHSILYANWLLTESLFVLLLVASVTAALTVNAAVCPSGRAALSGLLTGVCVLVRPAAQYFPPVATVLFLLPGNPGLERRVRAKCILFYWLAFAATIAPWAARNYGAYGQLGLSSQSGRSLLKWNSTYLEFARREGRDSVLEIQNELDARVRDRLGHDGPHNPFDVSRAQAKVAKEVILGAPLTYVVVHLKGMAMMFLHPDSKQIAFSLGWEPGLKPQLQQQFLAARDPRRFIGLYFRSKPTHEIVISLFVWAWLALCYTGAAWGLLRALRRGLWLEALSVCLVIGYFAALTGPVSNARYKLPTVPFYLALAGYGLAATRETTLPDP